MKLYSVIELSKRWGVSRTAIHNWINAGQLRAHDIKMSGQRPRWRVKDLDVLAFDPIAFSRSPNKGEEEE